MKIKKFLDSLKGSEITIDYIKSEYQKFSKEKIPESNLTFGDVFAIIDKFKGKNILLQEYISEAAGSDIRLFVIKDKVVWALRRQSGDGGFRSNITLGGKLTLYAPTIVESKLAIDATKAMGCEFAVVDMLKSITGSLVCEVNSIANINNFYECTGVDVCELLFKEIIKKAK